MKQELLVLWFGRKRESIQPCEFLGPLCSNMLTWNWVKATQQVVSKETRKKVQEFLNITSNKEHQASKSVNNYLCYFAGFFRHKKVEWVAGVRNSNLFEKKNIVNGHLKKKLWFFMNELSFEKFKIGWPLLFKNSVQSVVETALNTPGLTKVYYKEQYQLIIQMRTLSFVEVLQFQV